MKTYNDNNRTLQIIKSFNFCQYDFLDIIVVDANILERKIWQITTLQGPLKVEGTKT